MEANPLTDRELEVLRMVAAGHSNAAIASELAVNPLTIERHVQNVCNKLGVDNRSEAARRAAQNGWL